MKEFTQSLTLLPLTAQISTPSSPSSINSDSATVPGSFAAGQSLSPSIFPLRLSCSPFTFDPERTDDDGGPSYRCDTDFIIDMPSEAAISYLSRPRECIVELSDSEGNSYHIGTPTMPARVSIDPHLQRARLHVVCTMLFSPLQHPM